MNVVVTGSKGFIGQHLAERLRAGGHQVREVDKRRGEHTADVDTLTAIVDQHQADVIVHLGANCSTAGSIRDPAGDFADNAAGTFGVCEASRRVGGVPTVFVSSVKVRSGSD